MLSHQRPVIRLNRRPANTLLRLLNGECALLLCRRGTPGKNRDGKKHQQAGDKKRFFSWSLLLSQFFIHFCRCFPLVDEKIDLRQLLRTQMCSCCIAMGLRTRHRVNQLRKTVPVKSLLPILLHVFTVLFVKFAKCGLCKSIPLLGSLVQPFQGLFMIPGYRAPSREIYASQQGLCFNQSLLSRFVHPFHALLGVCGYTRCFEIHAAKPVLRLGVAFFRKRPVPLFILVFVVTRSPLRNCC